MTLKSFGCSFIFGSDLADDDSGKPCEKSSQLTWPALLSKDLGHTYQCHARPGSGNLRILEKVLTQANQSDNTDLFVIGWTWIDRFDYTVTRTGQDHAYDLAGENLWRTVMPVDTDNKANVYYRDLHSEFRDKLTTLINIKIAIDTLKQKNISFIMTYMDNLMFSTEWHTTPAIVDLQNYIHPYMTTFENLTFLDWSKQKGFLISKTLHPLEQAHASGAEYMFLHKFK